MCPQFLVYIPPGDGSRSCKEIQMMSEEHWIVLVLLFVAHFPGSIFKKQDHLTELILIFFILAGVEPVLLVLLIKQVRYIAPTVLNLLKLILSIF